MRATDEERKGWVAVDYAAYYERERKDTVAAFRFNLLVEVIAVAMDDARRERESSQ